MNLLKNPAVIIGLARAAIIFATTIGWAVTSAQQDAALNLLAVLLTVISLAFTGVTTATTQRKPVPVNEAKLSPPE